MIDIPMTCRAWPHLFWRWVLSDEKRYHNTVCWRLRRTEVEVARAAVADDLIAVAVLR